MNEEKTAAAGEQTQEQQEEMRELLRVRREKLDKLREGGNDPYHITSYPWILTRRPSRRNLPPSPPRRIPASTSPWAVA